MRRCRDRPGARGVLAGASRGPGPAHGGEVDADWLPVRVPAQDLAACIDILFENVFAHTPEGAGFAVRLTPRAGGGAWLMVSDEGQGFAGGYPVSRGASGPGSTGLGLDIARRIADSSGGSLTMGRSARGGAAITLALGATAAPREPDGVPGIIRHRPGRPNMRSAAGRRTVGVVVDRRP